MGKTTAWVTLATNDSYSLGALVVAYSLKRVHTVHDIAILITPGVSEAMRDKLTLVFDLVKLVDLLDSQDKTNLTLLKRPELGITFTKLHCWNLTQYEKCVFLDADTLILQNSDELFEREELSAAPDVGWPDCFNSGVFVFQPNNQTFLKLIQLAIEKGSYDGGDQGLLNLYFSDWAYKNIARHLPFIYNTCSSALYSYLPAFKQFGKNVKILHFIGTSKPWLQNFDTHTKTVHPCNELGHISSYLQTWWNIFCDDVHPKLTTEMGGIAGALAYTRLGEERSSEQDTFESHMRRQNWESGNIDYMGRDSFDNIWRRIQQTIETPPPEPQGAPARARTPTPQPEERARVTLVVAPKTVVAEPEVAAPIVAAPVAAAPKPAAPEPVVVAPKPAAPAPVAAAPKPAAPAPVAAAPKPAAPAPVAAAPKPAAPAPVAATPKPAAPAPVAAAPKPAAPAPVAAAPKPAPVEATPVQKQVAAPVATPKPTVTAPVKPAPVAAAPVAAPKVAPAPVAAVPKAAAPAPAPTSAPAKTVAPKPTQPKPTVVTSPVTAAPTKPVPASPTTPKSPTTPTTPVATAPAPAAAATTAAAKKTTVKDGGKSRKTRD